MVGTRRALTRIHPRRSYWTIFVCLFLISAMREMINSTAFPSVILIIPVQVYMSDSFIWQLLRESYRPKETGKLMCRVSQQLQSMYPEGAGYSSQRDHSKDINDERGNWIHICIKQCNPHRHQEQQNIRPRGSGN